MTVDADIIIVGAGLVGASSALALSGHGFKIILLDAGQAPTHIPVNARALTLSQGSARIFQTLGLWSYIQPHVTPVKKIHVSDRGYFGSAVLMHTQLQVDALGYVISAARLAILLRDAVRQLPDVTEHYPVTCTQVIRKENGISEVRYTDGAGEHHVLTASLIVGADGADSTLADLAGLEKTKSDYPQRAVLANITLSRDHHCTAYERFTRDGPMAMLPMSDKQCGLVWTVHEEDVDALLDLSDEAFLAKCQRVFGYRLGALTSVSERKVYALSRHVLKDIVVPGLVFVGNAAHSVHPVAGQGFNLGLRDVALLAEHIIAAKQQESKIGDIALLQKYSEDRVWDVKRTRLFTHGLIRLFGSRWLPVRYARHIGLFATDVLPWVRNGLARQSMGLNGKVPKLACGIRL